VDECKALDVGISHRVFIWLSLQQWFDAVHFADSRGRAYFTLTVRWCRLTLSNPR
jgi:hypothetical protein